MQAIFCYNLNMKNWPPKILGLVVVTLLLSSCTFAGNSAGLTDGTPGFFMGIWHGLLAPLSLIVRFFIDIQMYEMPNSGFGYDLGFLIGIVGAVPLGWLATLISIVFYLVA